MTSSSKPPLTAKQPRIASIDAYRGIVIFLMLAEVLQLPAVARAFPQSRLWQWVAFHTSHVPWAGCSLHDLIQPSFSFLVGVALPFSLASRRARGQSTGAILGHATWRSLILIVLGIALHSIGLPQTHFIFTDTLTLIGAGYLPLCLLGLAGARWQWGALVAILLGYWLAFAMYPLPAASFDYPAVGVPLNWPHHLDGLAGHWNKNSNLGWAFDTLWMNLFPRATTFTHNPGGYVTLNFVPVLATMLLGLLAGNRLRAGSSHSQTTRWLAGVGLACVALGYGCHFLDICPVVKRIWTPSWVLFSGGWCLLILAMLHLFCDVRGWQGWSLPFRVLGANAIVAYVMAHTLEPFIVGTLHTHLGPAPFSWAPSELAPLLQGIAVLSVYCLILASLYRRQIFIRL